MKQGTSVPLASPSGPSSYILVRVSRTFQALLVHTQPKELALTVKLLWSRELKVESASSFTAAMKKIRGKRYDILIVENASPVLDAFKFFTESIAHLPDAVRIVLLDEDFSAELIGDLSKEKHPVVRYRGLPEERSRLRSLVYEARQMLELVQQQKELMASLSLDRVKLEKRETLLDTVVKERTFELEESLLKLKSANRQALFGLAEAIETKDPYTKGHCGRVAAYALALARESGYPEEDLETLEIAAFLHDIGKIGIRDAVLLKPGPLDEDEWEHMREHPLVGYEIATNIELLKAIAPALRNHHERWDGKGYPDKLSGQKIPMSARIVAIADAFDAMSTDRPYKTGLPLDDCEKLLRKNAGKMFDAHLVEIFCKNHLGELSEGGDDEAQESSNGSKPRTSASIDIPIDMDLDDESEEVDIDM